MHRNNSPEPSSQPGPELNQHSAAPAASGPSPGRDDFRDAAAQASNRLVWRGQTGHYEVWFMTVYHPATQTAYWLRYTLESPEPRHGAPYVELWFCRADGKNPQRNFGIHRRFPLSSFSSAQIPFSLRIAESELAHDRAHGALTGAGHAVTWDLAWEPSPRLHQLLPAALYADPIGVAESLVVSPNHSVDVRGTITIDGERIDLRHARGGQSHIWGRKHAYAWGWGRCNAFEYADDQALATPARTVLESLSVRMRRGPVVLPLSVVSVYPEGLTGPEYAFKDIATMPLCRADFRTGSYNVTAQGLTCKIEVQYSCRPEDMVRTEYLDPDGTPAFCHFAGAASCRLTVSRRTFPGAAWVPKLRLRTDHGAQFEWAGRAGDSMVKTRHVRLED